MDEDAKVNTSFERVTLFLSFKKGIKTELLIIDVPQQEQEQNGVQ
jgi:hypothetical protein